MSTSSLLRRNKNTAYLDTDQDKDIVFFHLYQKMENIKKIKNKSRGTKNLLYFSVSSSQGYISLLEMCLKSIVQNTPEINFEILFITEPAFKPQIQQISCLLNFTYHFHEISTPEDGVGASINKLKIFDFVNINDFNKILFLDCDILCIQPINEIFNKDFEENYLQVACNPEVTVEAFLKKYPYFCLDYVPESRKKYILDNSPVPFNAGQFMFKNTNVMEGHFNAIIWLSSIWPGVYFFEQSFMNFYFTLHDMVKKDVLHNNVNFILVGNLPGSLDDPDSKDIKTVGFHTQKNGKRTYVVKDINDVATINDSNNMFDKIKLEGYSFLHFIGFALFSDKKIMFMEKFMKRKGLCL